MSSGSSELSSIIKLQKEGFLFADKHLETTYQLEDGLSFSVSNKIYLTQFDELIRLLSRNYPITALEFCSGNEWVKGEYYKLPSYWTFSGSYNNYGGYREEPYNPLNITKLGSLKDALLQNTTVTKLILKGTEKIPVLDPENVEIIAAILKANHTIEYLELEGNKIGTEGISVLAKAIQKNQSLKYLGLAGNTLDDTAIDILADALLNTTSIKHVDVSNNKLSDAGGFSLASILRYSSLTKLNLEGNSIGDQTAEAFAAILTINNTLSCLSFGSDKYGNKMGDRGVEALSRMIWQNRSLTHLHLDRCSEVGKNGSKAIAQSLQYNTSLHYFSFGHNKVCKEMVIDFAKALKINKSLQKIDLRHNLIGDQGAKFLGEALAVNRGLTFLGLRACNIDKGMEDLAKGLSQNSSLLELDLGGQNIGDPDY